MRTQKLIISCFLVLIQMLFSCRLLCVQCLSYRTKELSCMCLFCILNHVNVCKKSGSLISVQLQA
jgi:hypothetical protein